MEQVSSDSQVLLNIHPKQSLTLLPTAGWLLSHFSVSLRGVNGNVKPRRSFKNVRLVYRMLHVEHLQADIY